MSSICVNGVIYRLNWNRALPDFFLPRYKSLFPQTKQDFPPIQDLTFQMSPVFFQGNIGSCTSMAILAIVEFLQLKNIRNKIPLNQNPEAFESSNYEPLSKMFFYYNERRMDNTTGQDNGSSLTAGIAALQAYGICRESIWEYDESLTFQMPSQSAYDEASTHKNIVGFALDNDYERKHCIVNGTPFCCGISVYDSFFFDSALKTGNIVMPQAGEKLQGGHAICICGYDDKKQAWKFRNSWGVEWGLLGYGWIPYSYIINPELSASFWTVKP